MLLDSREYTNRPDICAEYTSVTCSTYNSYQVHNCCEGLLCSALTATYGRTPRFRKPASILRPLGKDVYISDKQEMPVKAALANNHICPHPVVEYSKHVADLEEMKPTGM